MSVDTPRPEYEKARRDWHRTRCALAGRNEVLDHAADFLPLTQGQRDNPDMRRIYCERATWYGGAAKTLDAWAGTLTRKPMTVEVPNGYKARLQNIDGEGTDIDGFSRHIVRKVFAYGRVGVLVDVSGSQNPLDANTVPYLSAYSAETIISWRTRMTTKGRSLDQVILKETGEIPHESGFGVSTRTAYRVLELDDRERYRIRLFTDHAGEMIEADPIYPTISGYNMDSIPFVFIGASSTSPAIERAPLQEVIDANFAHYMASAEYQWSLFWSASPTVVITGLSPDDNTTFQVGGGNAWKLPSGATAHYMEFNGPGLASLHASMMSSHHQMASLGASLLNEPKREVETAEALTIKSNGESASLVTVADTVSKALTQCLKIACEWEGYKGAKVSASLNRDLVNVRLTPQEMDGLVMMQQAGLLSLEDFFWNLQQGELLRPGVSIEDAIALAQVQAGIPPTPAAPPLPRPQ